MCSANQPEIVGATLETPTQDQLNSWFYFPTAVYTIQKPEFLEPVKEVAVRHLKNAKKERKLDEIYPVYMTGNLLDEPSMQGFSTYVSSTAWNILQGQGYDMTNFKTIFTELWCQEHYKHSAMEQHTHGFGVQIVGFYFIDVPDNSSRVVFHDPKAAKVQIGLPETNMNMVTAASNMINFEPKSGMLMFTNSWLAHSFTRHASTKPIRFIHFNLAVQFTPPQVSIVPVEVV